MESTGCRGPAEADVVGDWPGICVGDVSWPGVGCWVVDWVGFGWFTLDPPVVEVPGVVGCATAFTADLPGPELAGPELVGAELVGPELDELVLDDVGSSAAGDGVLVAVPVFPVVG